MVRKIKANVQREDLLGQSWSWSWSRLWAGDHSLQVEGGWSVHRVLGPRYRAHTIPDPHVVQLSVKQCRSIVTIRPGSVTVRQHIITILS